MLSGGIRVDHYHIGLLFSLSGRKMTTKQNKFGGDPIITEYQIPNLHLIDDRENRNLT